MLRPKILHTEIQLHYTGVSPVCKLALLSREDNAVDRTLSEEKQARSSYSKVPLALNCMSTRGRLLHNKSVPSHLQRPLVGRAVRQIEIDKGLVRKAGFFRLCFEIFDGFIINVDGDLLLQPFCIRIFPRIQILNIIFFSHALHPLICVIGFCLTLRCFSRGDYSNNIIRAAVTVADDTQMRSLGYSKNKEPIFVGRMIRVVKEYGIVIIENRRSFFKADSMFFYVSHF